MIERDITTNMFKRVSLIVVLLITVTTTFSQIKWELSKDKNGIKVYTGQEGSSKFKSIKVEAVFKGTLQKLESILMDVGRTTKWVYATKDAYVIKKMGEGDILYYTETSLPWPVSNRDIPIRMKLERDAGGRNLKVTATGVPGAVPEKKGIVRLPFFNALWTVAYDGKNNISIDYVLKMDPGGSVPTGITNMFVTKGPYETFENLGKLLSSSE